MTTWTDYSDAGDATFRAVADRIEAAPEAAEAWACVCGHDGLPEQWHADHCLNPQADTGTGPPADSTGRAGNRERAAGLCTLCPHPTSEHWRGNHSCQHRDRTRFCKCPGTAPIPAEYR